MTVPAKRRFWSCIANLFPDCVLLLPSFGYFRTEFSYVSEYRDATTGQWRKLRPFIYPNGETDPPLYLRDPAEQNYLDPAVRAAGLSLMGIALITIAISSIWALVYRHHPAVIRAQPPFLQALCLGSATTTMAILATSYDESYGATDEQLTMACTAVPWLLALGHNLTYGVLFCKVSHRRLLVCGVLGGRGTTIKQAFLTTYYVSNLGSALSIDVEGPQGASIQKEKGRNKTCDCSHSGCAGYCHSTANCLDDSDGPWMGTYRSRRNDGRVDWLLHSRHGGLLHSPFYCHFSLFPNVAGGGDGLENDRRG